MLVKLEVSLAFLQGDDANILVRILDPDGLKRSLERPFIPASESTVMEGARRLAT